MSTEKRVVDFEGSRGERQVSAFELARFHAGELSKERRAEIERLLASDASLAAELEDLRAGDAAFRTQMPFERFASDHEARAAKTGGLAGVLSRLRALRWHVGGGVVATAAAAILLVLLVPTNDPGVDPTGGNRLKGPGARIGFFVKASEGPRWGTDGETLRAGDRIQFAVKDPDRARSMVIVGVDGRGEVSTYVARRMSTGTPKGEREGAPRLLEQSLVLDDAVGVERFFVVYGDTDVETLTRAAEAAAREVAQSGADLSTVERLPLSLDDVEQGSVHIRKVPE